MMASVDVAKHLLVGVPQTPATCLDAGSFFKLMTTTFSERFEKGTVLIALPNGKKVMGMK